MTAALSLAEADERFGADAVSQAARHALWRRGDLSWMLHDGVDDRAKGQRAALRLVQSGKGRRYVFNIARRWGKSHFFATQAIETCLRTPKARVPYAASTVTSLREFIVPIFAEIIDTAPPDVRPEIVKDEVRFPHNGSRIVLAACEDKLKANRLRGPKAHRAIIDEAGFIPILRYVVTSVLLYQLATTRGIMLIGSSPPETPAHEFVEFFREADVSQCAMTATIYDAPFVDRETIAELCTDSGGPDAISWRREGLAEFVVDTERALVPEFAKMESTIVVECGGAEHVDRYIVGDLGFVDLTFALFAEWNFADSMLDVVDEYVEARATTSDVQHRVDAVARERWGDAPIYRRSIDASAIVLADLRRLQDDDDPTAEHHWRMARNQDRDAAVNQLRLAIGRGRWRIHPRCEQLRAHLRNGIWNEKRTAFDRVKGYGHFDGVAAAMYLEREVDRTHNPAPPEHFNRYAQIVTGGAKAPAASAEIARLHRMRDALRPRRDRR